MTITLDTTDSKATPPVEDIEALLDISDEEFTEVLTDAIMQANGPTSQEPDWQCLFAPEVIVRTAKALGKLNLLVQTQLSEVGSRLFTEHLPKSELAAARKARGGLLLFRSRLISRGVEAKEIRERLHLARMAAQPTKPPPSESQNERVAAHADLMERNARRPRDAVRLLALAIHQHRLSAVAAGLTPEPSDRELWRTLNEVTLDLSGRTISLTEMLGTGVWTKERG